MMTDQAILQRLHDKGWWGNHLGDKGEDGETALMVALQHPEFRTKPYQDQALVEALLEHPAVDVFALDNDELNAFSYVWNFEHAYPLLVAKGLDINHLDKDGDHFLVYGVIFIQKPEETRSYHQRLEMALSLGLNPHMLVQGKPFIDHFSPPLRETIERFIQVKEEQVLLSRLPDAQGIKLKPSKL